ncbi:head-tail connector protein [Alkalihalobacillus sp. BA299]|uniref:phage head-tail connector protein n=1 Tax=Alkalihalobacillus sp. BA299 TaxID=2815938 RepID=UPI001ADB093B
MTILNDVKSSLRISSSQTAFDGEIIDLIEEARNDLILSGVTSEKANGDTDALIKRAIKTYAKANFGWDNPDADRLQKSYELLKQHLSLSQEYSLFTVTFIIDDGAGGLLENAIVTFNDEERITNTSGEVVFKGISEAHNMAYTVTLDGYSDVDGVIDVEGSLSISVSMAVI